MAYSDIEQLLKFYQSENLSYDNNLYNEEREFSIISTVLNSAAIKKIGAEQTQVIFYSNNQRTSSIRKSCYGRPCLVASFTEGYIGEDNLLHNARISLKLCGCNALGQRIVIDEFYAVQIYWNEADYSGGEQSIINVIHQTMEFPALVGGGAMFVANNEWFGGLLTEIELNIPLFINESDADNYTDTGEPTNDINNRPTSYDRKPTYYYIYDYYKLDETNNSSRLISNKVVNFKLNDTNDKVAFVNKGGNKYELECTTNNIIIGYEVEDSETGLSHWEYRQGSFTDIAISVIDGISEGYKGSLSTNIEKVNNLSEASGNPNNNIVETFNGTDDITKLNQLTLTAKFVNAYYLEGSELVNFARVIFANDENFIETLKKGLWMYNENPIDSVVDLCYYPISLDGFISGRGSSPIKFGAFVYNGEVEGVPSGNYGTIQSTHGTVTLVNQKIQNIYNDYRDILSVSYSLFLPFYGIVELDNIIVGNILKIECKFDVFTSQLKYYIFINNVISGCYETSIGRHISILGNTWVTKSGQNFESAKNIALNIPSAIGNIASGNISGLANSGLNIVNGIQQSIEKPTTLMKGVNTSGLNIYDPLNVFLIIEQYETIKPLSLNNDYGIPCYKIVTLNQCKGFTVCNDVKLTSLATDEEQNEIINLLKEGIII